MYHEIWILHDSVFVNLKYADVRLQNKYNTYNYNNKFQLKKWKREYRRNSHGTLATCHFVKGLCFIFIIIGSRCAVEQPTVEICLAIL